MNGSQRQRTFIVRMAHSSLNPCALRTCIAPVNSLNNKNAKDITNAYICTESLTAFVEVSHTLPVRPSHFFFLEYTQSFSSDFLLDLKSPLEMTITSYIFGSVSSASLVLTASKAMKTSVHASISMLYE